MVDERILVGHCFASSEIVDLLVPHILHSEAKLFLIPLVRASIRISK